MQKDEDSTINILEIFGNVETFFSTKDTEEMKKGIKNFNTTIFTPNQPKATRHDRVSLHHL